MVTDSGSRAATVDGRGLSWKRRPCSGRPAGLRSADAGAVCGSHELRPPLQLPVRLPCARDEDRCAGRVSGQDDRRPQTGNKPCSRSRSRSGSARDAGMPMGSERSDWKKRNQSRRAIGIVPDHSSRTCSDLAILSVQIIAETGVTYTGLASSFAGSGHTVLDSPTAQSLTPGDFLDAIASADLVEPDQLASMNRRGNLGPGSRTRTLHVCCLALVGACGLAPLCDRSDNVLAISVDPRRPASVEAYSQNALHFVISFLQYH